MNGIHSDNQDNHISDNSQNIGSEENSSSVTGPRSNATSEENKDAGVQSAQMLHIQPSNNTIYLSNRLDSVDSAITSISGTLDTTNATLSTSLLRVETSISGLKTSLDQMNTKFDTLIQLIQEGKLNQFKKEDEEEAQNNVEAKAYAEA